MGRTIWIWALAVTGTLLAAHEAGAGRRCGEAKPEVWTATGVAGDAEGGERDADTFLVHHGKGDRLRVTLRTGKRPARGTRFKVRLAPEGDDARAFVHRSHSGQIRLSRRLRHAGTMVVSVVDVTRPADAPTVPAPAHPVSGSYEIRLETPPGAGTVADEAPIVSQPDAESPVVTGPGGQIVDPPLPSEPPAPPAELHCTLSGSGTVPASWHVDDALDLYVDGVLVYTDGHNGSGDRAPVTFTAHHGSQVRVVARDWFGVCAWVSDLYVLVDEGPAVSVTPRIHLGCGRPGGGPDDGEFFDRTVTVRASQ